MTWKHPSSIPDIKSSEQRSAWDLGSLMGTGSMTKFLLQDWICEAGAAAAASAATLLSTRQKHQVYTKGFRWDPEGTAETLMWFGLRADQQSLLSGSVRKQVYKMGLFCSCASFSCSIWQGRPCSTSLNVWQTGGFYLCVLDELLLLIESR